MCTLQNLTEVLVHVYTMLWYLSLSCYTLGLLSKSMGQILRVAVCIHALFTIESASEPIPTSISTEAVKAAIDFVEVCSQQTAFLAGRGKIDDDIGIVSCGKCHSTCLHNILHIRS